MTMPLIGAILTFLITVFPQGGPGDTAWTSLLDRDLSKWGMYLSYKHQPGYNGAIPLDRNGVPIAPIGYDRNVNDVFSVSMEDGGAVLRISGEIYGCVFTKQEFRNYHLRLEVKLGSKKWEPRLDEAMDSGILYHSQGECGVDYWRSWMRAQEFQIMEKGFGDYWCVGPTGGQIRMHNPNARNDMGIYDPNGTLTPMGVGGTRTGFVRHNDNFEKPGEWNTVELICYQDKSVHIVNGHVVMAISNSVYREGDALKPLVAGKIQLQSEAAEVFYKEILIKSISALPDQYSALFDSTE
jgi:hypothetical protein